MKAGCYTALITPFKGDAIDWEGLDRLVDFQIQNGITGILAVGTTGESPVLTWDEHNEVTERIARKAAGKCLCIAGTGSNNTAETLEGTHHAAQCGCQAVLLVTPTTTARARSRSAGNTSPPSPRPSPAWTSSPTSSRGAPGPSSCRRTWRCCSSSTRT